MALTMLPAFAIPLAWTWLKDPPPSGSPATDSKTRSLSDYYERTLISGDFPPSLWSHYDNVGPRTTNVAEGWHNSLNSHFGVSHPSLRVFLHWLQKFQYSVQCRGIQLAAGRSPKARALTYVQLDNRHWSAKVNYSMEIGQIFSVFSTLHPMGFCVAMTQFRAATASYLRREAYLLDC